MAAPTAIRKSTEKSGINEQIQENSTLQSNQALDQNNDDEDMLIDTNAIPTTTVEDQDQSEPSNSLTIQQGETTELQLDESENQSSLLHPNPT